MADERRRYFRIDDSMGVAYQTLGEAEAKALSRERGHIDFASNFDNRIQTLLESCRIQSPLAAELIDLVNKKLNFVIQQMELDDSLIQKIAHTLRQVNVSACGMAFASDEPLPKEQLLQLELQLHPSQLRIACLAKVVACDLVADTEGLQSYFLRLDFIDLAPSDQELLIQHIVKRQSVQIHQQREQQE